MYIFATSALALKSMPTANPGLVALLRSWTTAAENANHSSQQASTLRKAARSLAAHPTPVTCKEDALNVKFIGEKIASSVGDWLAFERLKQLSDVRTIARLRHLAEERWWSVRICGNMAWRSWGKHSGGIDFSGMDNWEHCQDASAALVWAVAKATKQLAKGYEHAVGSQDMYESARESAKAAAPPPRARATAAATAASASDPQDQETYKRLHPTDISSANATPFLSCPFSYIPCFMDGGSSHTPLTFPKLFTGPQPP